MREDNFGDHKRTEAGRTDATTRAPFDMGLGSRKKIYLKCECGKILEVKKTTVRVMCGGCGTDIEVEKAKRADVEEAYQKTKVMLEPAYLKFREHSEKRAWDYKNGKR
jgi:hypothetical protein